PRGAVLGRDVREDLTVGRQGKRGLPGAEWPRPRQRDRRRHGEQEAPPPVWCRRRLVSTEQDPPSETRSQCDRDERGQCPGKRRSAPWAAGGPRGGECTGKLARGRKPVGGNLFQGPVNRGLDVRRHILAQARERPG